jgi:uncharacterized membrane protein YoaK (UPF0700 family)
MVAEEQIQIKQTEITHERVIHHAASVVGGFMGAYALLNHADMFASSQTSNMIRMVSRIITGITPKAWLVMFGAMIMYAIGLSLTVLIPKYTPFTNGFSSCVITTLCSLALAFIPTNIEHEVALYPIFFAMAFQWDTFGRAGDYISSTIFSTNNLKQFVLSTTEFVCERKEGSAARAKFYLITIFFYHVGVVLSTVTYLLFREKGIWFVFIPLLILTYMVISFIGVFRKA